MMSMASMLISPPLRVFFIVLWLLVPLLVLAHDPDDIARARADSTSVSAGKRQFQQTCGFCHGPDGRGASGPDLIRSPLVSHDENGNLIGPVVRNGRPEKGMPAFQLSDAEINNIAQFLHSQAKIAASVARRIPSEYPLEKLLVGSADEGKAFFDGPGNCKSCHSPSGDLAHVASKYKPFDLQTRIVYPSGLRPSLTVRDSSGRSFTGEQVYADEFLVSLRDKNGWVYSWKRDTVQVAVKDPLAAHEKLLKVYTDKNVHDLFAYLQTFK
jgi:cytochrome c oxidase cbb3-type subunit III